MKRFLAALTLVFAGVTLWAQADLQPLATVKLGKTESITLRQLKQRVEMYRRQTGKDGFTLDEKKQILDALIDEKLVLQAAAKANVSVTDAQVNQYFLQNISQQVGRVITEVEFGTYIQQQTGKDLDAYMTEQTGMSVPDFKAYLKNQLTAQQYLVRENQGGLQEQAPTDKEIRDFFASNQSSFSQNEMLKLLLVVAAKGNDLAGAKQQITSLYNDTKGKTSDAALDALKRTYPSGPTVSSKIQAGDIFVPRSPQTSRRLGITAEQLSELFGRNVGFVSDIQETPTDFQFYVVRERYPARMLGLVDVVQPDSTITVYEYIRGQLGQEKQAAFMLQSIKAMTEKLRTPQNFEMKKSGAALDALLSW